MALRANSRLRGYGQNGQQVLAIAMNLAKVGYTAFRYACWPFCHITACEKLPVMAVFTKIESRFDAHVRPAFATWAGKANAMPTYQTARRQKAGRMCGLAKRSAGYAGKACGWFG